MMRMIFVCLAAMAMTAGAASAETRALSGFHSVSASGRVEVEIIIGEAYSVELSGPRTEQVITRIRGDELVIETPRHRRGWRGRDAHIRITMPQLRELDVAAGAEVSARAIAAGAFELDASSGASVELEGRCRSLNLDASSGANIRAAQFICDEVRADASSGANATLHAARAISVDVSSGANVRWGGQAAVRQVEASSGGTARRLN